MVDITYESIEGRDRAFMGTISENLTQLYNSDEYPMHMPGHKRQPTGQEQLDAVHAIDITEIEGYDNLYDAHGILRDAMDYAGRLYDCPHTYYLVNGSTGGILIAIHTVAAMYGERQCTTADEHCNIKNVSLDKRDRILVASGCHRSVWAGAKLAHLKTDIIDTEYIDIRCSPDVYTESTDASCDGDKSSKATVCIHAGISPASLEKKLNDAEVTGERYAAVVITSPTYEGIISDIEVISDTCHRYDTVLIVDEAHGAHLDLSDAYPGGALRYGADIVIHSTHKTMAAMTQTALLHAQGSLVDITTLEKYWTMLQTSSPSYVLMASIDNALHHITENQDMVRKHLGMVRNAINVLKGQADIGIMSTDPNIDAEAGRGLKVLKILTPDDILDRDYIVALDPCKIVVFTGKSGIDGYTLQRILLDEYHIQIELATDDYILGITTYMDTEEGLRRLTDALLLIDRGLADGAYREYTEAPDLPHKEHSEDKTHLYAPCVYGM